MYFKQKCFTHTSFLWVHLAQMQLSIHNIRPWKNENMYSFWTAISLLPCHCQSSSCDKKYNIIPTKAEKFTECIYIYIYIDTSMYYLYTSHDFQLLYIPTLHQGVVIMKFINPHAEQQINIIFSMTLFAVFSTTNLLLYRIITYLIILLYSFAGCSYLYGYIIILYLSSFDSQYYI